MVGWQAAQCNKLQQQRLQFTPPHLHDWQKTELVQFLADGFPTRQDEKWRYTNVKPIIDQSFLLSSSAQQPIDIDIKSSISLDSHRLVFINGQFSAQHSDLSQLPDTVTIKPLSQITAEQWQVYQSVITQTDHSTCFTHLNAALLQDSWFVSIAAQTQLTKPLHCIYYHTGQDSLLMQHPRHLIQLADGASATILAEYCSD